MSRRFDHVRCDVVVVGAGVFGAWTARKLQEAGRRVLLVDAWGPAHARASSGGESRMIRGAYGSDEIYTRMALESLDEWHHLSASTELPLLHAIGVLFFFPRAEPFLEQTLAAHRRLGLPTELLDELALRRRFPQIDFTGIEAGLFEPQFGALMARRAVQILVAQFVDAGGEYRHAAVLPPSGRQLESVETKGGQHFAAEQFVFACGPWLGRLFPELLGSRIFPTRQEVFFFAPEAGDTSYAAGRLPGWADFNAGDLYYGFPDLLGSRIFPTRQEVFFFAPEPGDTRFTPGRLPAWADFNNGDLYYGVPDLEGRGFKIAHDAHGPRIDPDSGDRTPSAEALAGVRAYMERRFPGLRGAPLSEARVCQYENSANGDFLIDMHPDRPNLLLVGAGSGHGFKHGPAVGRYAAGRLLGTLDRVEPRFSLASKGETQNRAVH